jgi:lipopolysaccharide/colanic/teichoic acid biosynthesis glycosyltransferase
VVRQAEHPPAVHAGGAPTRAQRALDVVVALLLLPVVLLVGAVVAVAILLDSPGPVFYRAPRIGRHGRPLSMLKFRTMRSGSEGPSLASFRDVRLTPVGRFLRETKLDELPQVWHVLKGDMRFVGPRPELAEFVALHAEEYRRILSAPPGITGLAQLAYARESRLLDAPQASEVIYREEVLPRKVALDLEYVETQGFRRDLVIIVRTLGLPLRVIRNRWSALVQRGGRRRILAYAVMGIALLTMLAAYVAAEGEVA